MNFSGGIPVGGNNRGFAGMDTTLASAGYKTRLRLWLIAAPLLSAAHAGALAAEPQAWDYAAVSGWDDSEPARPSRIQAKPAGIQPGSKDAVLASQIVRPLNRTEIGIGLSHAALPNGSNGWYGVYLQSLDRVAERNTIYGMQRETPRPGLNDSNASPAHCCQRSIAPTSFEQYANAMAAPGISPTFYLFGISPKKSWKFNLDETWKVRAGVRYMQYNDAPRTKVGFLTLERRREYLRTSYSYQLERSGGGSPAASHVVQFDYQYSLHDSIGVAAAYGREFANFGPLGHLNTQVRNVALRGQHWFKQDWALTFQAGYSYHGNMPAQSGVRLGLRHSF